MKVIVEFKQPLFENNAGVKVTVFKSKVLVGSWTEPLPVLTIVIVFLSIHTDSFVWKAITKGVIFAKNSKFVVYLYEVVRVIRGGSKGRFIIRVMAVGWAKVRTRPQLSTCCIISSNCLKTVYTGTKNSNIKLDTKMISLVSFEWHMLLLIWVKMLGRLNCGFWKRRQLGFGSTLVIMWFAVYRCMNLSLCFVEWIGSPVCSLETEV